MSYGNSCGSWGHGGNCGCEGYSVPSAGTSDRWDGWFVALISLPFLIFYFGPATALLLGGNPGGAFAWLLFWGLCFFGSTT